MKLVDMTLVEFSDEVDSNSPAPGGGSVAALSGNIGIALARMMAHLSFGKKKFEALDEEIKVEFTNRFNKLSDLRKELIELVDKDTESFNSVMKAFKLPKETDEEKKIRKKEIQEATISSIEIPYKTAQLSMEALSMIDYIKKYGNKNVVTDICVGALMLHTAIKGAVLNIKVNLIGIEDETLKNSYSKKCEELLAQSKRIKDTIMSEVNF